MVRKYEKHDYDKKSFRFESRIFSDAGSLLLFLTADYIPGFAPSLSVWNRSLSIAALSSEIDRFLLRFNKVLVVDTMEDDRLLF